MLYAKSVVLRDDEKLNRRLVTIRVMSWRPALKQFGVRLVICLVLLGGLYLATFGLPGTSHNKPQTAKQKVTALRAALNQSYLASSSLAGFNENDPLSYYSLGSLGGQLKTNAELMQKRLSTAPREVKPEIKQRITGVVERQQKIAADFATSYDILSRVIAYDPGQDLGKLDINKDLEKLSQRAAAAENGLKKTATNSTPVSSSSGLSVQENKGTPLVVHPVTKEALLKQADCLGRLARQLDAKQTGAAQTRSSCTNDYSSARKLAITNVIQNSFPDSQKQYMDKTVPNLLKQLDRLAGSLR